MAVKTIVEKAAEKVGYGLAMAEDVAGSVKTAVGAAMTNVTKSLKAPPGKAAKKAAKKAVAQRPAKKEATKNAVKKTAAKQSPTKKTAARRASNKSEKRPAKKAAAR
jgi:hypothetical protein